MVCILKTKKYAVVSDKLFAYIPHFRQHNSCCFCFYLCYALMERQYMEIFCPVSLHCSKNCEKNTAISCKCFIGVVGPFARYILRTYLYTTVLLSLLADLKQEKGKRSALFIYVLYWHANYLLTHDISSKLPFASFCNNIPNIFNVKQGTDKCSLQ